MELLEEGFGEEGEGIVSGGEEIAVLGRERLVTTRLVTTDDDTGEIHEGGDISNKLIQISK